MPTTNYLQSTYFINSDAAEVVEYAQAITDGLSTSKEKAIALFYHIRDAFRYNPYHITINMKATDILKKNFGHCVDKACLLAACGRAVGIPSRVGFGAVKNHIGTARLEEILKSDILAFHGYTEFFLDAKWVKATPAFNRELCEKLGVEPLEFDGENDCMFQEYNSQQGKFMEYIADYGQFDDVPFDLFIEKMQAHYPHLFEQAANGTKFEVGELKVAL